MPDALPVATFTLNPGLGTAPKYTLVAWNIVLEQFLCVQCIESS